MSDIDLSKLSAEEKSKLLRELSEEQANRKKQQKDAFEGIRAETLHKIKMAVFKYIEEGKAFKKWLRGESEAYFEILKEYGQLKRDEQIGFKLNDETFKLQVKGNRVKKFDERADIAEKRLVEFLTDWVKNSEKGTSDPMYKLCMKMLARNEEGDLDYKSISYLYEMESDFNSAEYSEIMNLFRESNTTEKTVIHFYFEEKDKYNNWKKLEPSFNKM